MDATYENGFVDAVILSINIDYQNRIAMLRLSLRGNKADSPDASVYDQATLLLRHFYHFSIEPPDPDRLSYPKEAEIQMDGFSEDPIKFPVFERLRPTLAADAFCCQFFVHNWNSFIHIAAKDAEFSWMPERTR